MSRKVDERVVSMKFDNKHFEENVKTTMSTLDKLKAKLSLKGSAKAAQNEFAAYRSGFISLADSVNKMWASLEQDIANRMKSIMKMFTIDPLKTGWNEYELKMGSVQTIMASTGETLSTVNRYLDELNRYSDDTIYSFADMTQNIGKFTNAGVKLEDAVLAIKGIANEAALSGANANEASRAMYNFSQALSSGYVKLIDWKSIELANMATVGFKEQLIATAVEMGTLKKASDGMYQTLDGNLMSSTKNFNETLQDQWMTSEVLIKTLGKYADETTDIGKKATQAATEVKTFSQLMDTLRESAQSGWARTWEIMFGDFEEGKQLWTMMSKTVGGFIDKMNQARNNLLEGVFSSPWKKFDSLLSKTNVSAETFRDTVKGIAKENGTDIDKLTEKYGSFEAALSAGAISADVVKAAYEKLIGAEKGAVASTEEAADKLKYFQEVVSKVWHGDYANGEARVKALTAAGYDYAQVQALVNKTVDGHKLTLEDLTDAQLKSVGCTDEQVKSIRELEQIAKESGVSLNDLMEQMGKPSGRWLLIESLKNACSGLGKVFGALKQAWLDIFRPDDLATRTKKIYSFIEAIHKFSAKLIPTEETVKNMTRTFKGLFAAIDIVATLVMGPLKIAFKLVTAILGEFGLNIWDVTAVLGDGLVKLRNWIDGVLDFGAAAKRLADPIREGMKAFKEWIASLKESDNIPRDIILGLAKGFAWGIKEVFTLARDLALKIITTVKDTLGIHSPSTVFFQIGVDTILGWVKGLWSMVGALWEVLKDIGTKFVGYVREVDFGNLLAGGLLAGTLGVTNKIANALLIIAKPFAGLGDMFEGLGDMFEGFGKAAKKIGSYFAAKAWSERASALIKVAIAIAILAAAIALLTYIDTDKIWPAIGAIGALAAILGVLAFAMASMSKVGKNDPVSSLSASLKNLTSAVAIISFALAIILLAGAIKLLSTIPADKVKPVLGILAALAGGILAFVMISKVAGEHAKSAGKMVAKIAFAILMLVLVIKLIDTLSPEAIFKGMLVLGVLGLFMTTLVITSKIAGEHAKQAGKMITRIGFTLLLLVGVIALIGLLDDDAILRGLIVISALELMFVALVAVSKLAGQNAGKAGSMLLQMSLAILILVGVIYLIDDLDGKAITKGLGAIVLLGAMFAAMIYLSKDAGKETHKLAMMFVGMAAAMGILAAVIFILGQLDTKSLAKGLTAVLLMGLMFAVVLRASKDANACQGTLVVLAITIGLLVAALVGLSFIDSKDLAAATLALVGVIGVFALLLKATSTLKTGKKSFTRTLVTLGVLVLVVAALGGVIAVMSHIANPQTVLPVAGAIGVLLLALSASMLILAQSKTMSKQKLTRSIVAVGALTIVIAALGLVLAMMSGLKTANAISNAAGLSILLLALTGSVAILSTLGGKKMISKSLVTSMLLLSLVFVALGAALGIMSKMGVTGAISNAIALSILATTLSVALIPLTLIGNLPITTILKGVVGLAAMAVPLIAFVGVLALMQNVNNAMANVKALTLLATALTLLLIPLSLVGILIGASGGLALLGVVGLLAMAVPLLAFVGVLAVMSLVPNAIDNARALTDLMLVMGTMLIALSAVGPLALIGVAAMAGLTLLMGGIGVFAVAVGALVDKFPVLEVFLDKGLALLEKLAYGIGSIVGNFAGGLIGGATSFLPDLGTMLSDFMNNATDFVTGIKMVDETAITGVKNLTAAILLLTAADLVNNLTSFIGGDFSLVALGLELSGFMRAIQPFIAGASLLNEDMMLGVKSLAQTILILTAADIINGLTSWITGGASLATFGAQLPGLGTNLSTFATNLGSFGKDKVESVNCAAQALKYIAEAANEMPVTEDGIWQKFVGGKSIATFGSYLPQLGTHLTGFITNLGTFDKAKVETAKLAAEALKHMAEAADEMPVTENGFWQKFIGGKSIETFGGYLPTLGTNLSSFVTNLGTFDKGKVETSKLAAEALAAMASAAENMPEEGGWWKKLTGGGDKATLGEFSQQLPDVATALSDFVKNLGTFNSDSITTVKAGVSAINAFADLGAVDLSSLAKNLPSFGESMTSFAGKIKSFATNMTEVSATSITAAVDNVNKLLDVFKNFNGTNVDAVKTFSDSLKSLGETSVDKFVGAFTNAADRVKTAGIEMIQKFISGATEQSKTANENFKQIASNGAEALRDKHQSFYNAGSYLVDGFAAGISENDFKAAAKAKAMADAAEAAAKEALDINSPSKVFRAIGAGVPEGFAQGIDKFGCVVSTSTENMADTAIGGVKNSITEISKAVSEDLDAQPTIRPVLDLSDVRSGARDLASMFGDGNVLTSVGSISASMNNRGQNGTTDDIISAIKELGSMERNSYTINGINYAEGSDVAEAIKILVRAATVERRT